MRQINTKLQTTLLKVQGLCFNISENTQACFIPTINVDAFDNDVMMLEDAFKAHGKYCLKVKDARSIGYFPKNRQIFEAEAYDDVELCLTQHDMDQLNEF